MQFWTNIVQTALLGTDKKQIGPAELTADMEVAASAIHANTETDREEKFLQMAALAFNYRQSGILPFHKANIDMGSAPAEERPYCSEAAQQALKDILSQDSPALLSLWLRHCANRQQLAHPIMLPVLLNKATQQKAIRPLVEECAGKRGEWLSQFNEDWHFAADLPDEELWQTGSLEQRTQVLQRVSHSDQQQAKAWLQQTWAQENAATRTELLKNLPPALFADDPSWLEGLLKEKSQKVKDEALRLLKLIPSSSIIQQYWQIVQQAVTLVKEKTMLGLLSKTKLQIQLPAAIDESIFKTGIDKISSKPRKGLTDDDMIIFQLISHIPPHFWESYLQETPAHIVDLFLKDAEAVRFLPAIGIAAARFENRVWAPFIIADERTYYHDLLPLLPAQELEKYLVKHFSQFPEDVIRFLTQQQNDEWGWEISKELFKYIAKNPYQYNRAFFNRHIHLIPVQIAGELENAVPKEEHLRSSWTGISEHIRQLLTLKVQTIKAFQ